MADRKPLRYRGFMFPPLPRWANYLVATLTIALAAYSLFVLIRGTATAIDGEGDPEIIWPALLIIAFVTFLLIRAGWRMIQRFRATGPSLPTGTAARRAME